MTSPRAPRADAARNRARLLECARSVFAKRGPDASVNEIAKAAGVGQGTAFRHFPTKEALLCAAMQEHVDGVVDLARTQLEVDDPWDALEGFCLGMVARYQADRGFVQAVKQDRLGPEAEACRVDFESLVGTMLDRAKAAGVVRDDIEVADIGLMLTAAGDAGATGASMAQPDAGTRILRLMLDGMRPTRATTPLA